jgi:hypothetical protein
MNSQLTDSHRGLADDKQTLLTALDAVGKTTATLSNAAGQSVMVLPYGGRVLGLFSEQIAPNFLWTNPALRRTETTRELFKSIGWHNSGGDRTWLAPELDFFFPSFPDVSVYLQPRQLDACRYSCSESETEISLDAEFDIHSFRSETNFSVRISKSISLTGDPLTGRRTSGILNDVQFAGYRMRTCLVSRGPHPRNEWLGIWNLLQLPGGGEFVAPTYHRVEPTIFFGNVPADHLRSDSRMIHYRMQAKGEQKICIPALATTGRMGYRYVIDGQHALVVRSFVVDPGGAYKDVCCANPADDGYAVQACNINSDSLGCFAEMEYHVPAIGGHAGSRISEDVSFVWAYRGRREEIERAGHLLLGTEV